MAKKVENIRMSLFLYWLSTILYSLSKAYAAFFFTSTNSTEYFIFLGLPNWFSIELGVGLFLGSAILILPQISPRLKEWSYFAFGVVEISAIIANLSLKSFTFFLILSAVLSVSLLIVSYKTYHVLYADHKMKLAKN